MSKQLNIQAGDKTLVVDCDWFHNDGERWSFLVDVSIKEVRCWSYQASYTLSLSDVDDAISFLEEEGKVKLPVSFADKKAIVDFTEASKKTFPKTSAHEAYYGH